MVGIPHAKTTVDVPWPPCLSLDMPVRTIIVLPTGSLLDEPPLSVNLLCIYTADGAYAVVTILHFRKHCPACPESYSFGAFIARSLPIGWESVTAPPAVSFLPLPRDIVDRHFALPTPLLGKP